VRLRDSFFDCGLFDPVWVELVLGWWLVICEPFGFVCFLSDGLAGESLA
jgi:hypothetical protein